MEVHIVGPNGYGFESLNHMREASGVIWNSDIFEREGLPSLYELIDSDGWMIRPVMLDW